MSTTELQRLISIASLTEEACTLNVDVVIKDLTKNKTAKEFEMRKLGSFCQNVLLNKVVIVGCSLRMQDCKLAKTYGICHIFVKNCVGNLESNPKFYIVSRKTHIEVDMIHSEAYHDLRAKLTPSPLGGVSYEVQQLSLLFRYNRCHLNSPHRPVGVLLHGPPGCGKTSLGKYLAHVHHAVFMNIEGTDILQSEYGSGAVKLKSIFTQAKSLAEEGPVVLFLDEIDTICPAHEKASLGNRQLTGALVLEMDVLHDENVSGLIVVAATNFISSVHPALRRPGRFDNEVLINIPTKEQRMSIMTLYTSDMNLSKDVSIPELASWTVGYVGADLKALCEQAASHAQGTQSLTKKPVVEMPHFKLALHSVSPSLKKGLDFTVELQPVKWDDIGGLEEVKEEIKQAVEWPLLYPEALRRMDVSATKGVLLYGPPGCCKTTLVRAAATACHVTFLSLSGAQVYSPYVGESERIISEAFQKARALSPAILFLDEIESLVGKRTVQGKQSRVQERILSTLLNEMDGVGTRLDKKMDASLTRDGEGDAQELITNVNLPNSLQHTDPVPYVDKSRVIVIGATNRPDMLDHAIMRPGRLDKLIYVPSPDVQSRLAILKIYTAKMSTQDVDVEELSGNTNNFSGADLKNLCKEAGLVALRENLQVKNTDHSSLFVRHTHFVEAMKTVQGSLQSGEWCKFYGINRIMAKRVTDLSTPCFLVDIDKVKRNADRMIKTCKTLGIQLRSHTKTHKTIEAAVLQTDGTKRCIAVSTLAEAELYADNGFDDILLAYPITEDKIKRCLALVGRLQQFHVMISGDCGLKCLENHINELPEGKVWSVMVEIDAGYGRTGYCWSDFDAIHHVAKRIKESPKMTLEKLYYHCGSLYNVKTDHERKELQSTHVDRMLEVQNKLNLHGINCTSGIGSTPTCSLAITKNSELTEFHPGNYIFYDYEQYLLGTCTEDDIACCVMTRVIAHKPEKQTILVDCGFTAIGHDGMRQRLPSDFCLIQGHSNLRLVGMTQEIGMIVAKEGELDCSLYPVGTIFYLLPYHSCAAAAMHTVYHIHSGDDITAVWKPVRGW